MGLLLIDSSATPGPPQTVVVNVVGAIWRGVDPVAYIISDAPKIRIGVLSSPCRVGDKVRVTLSFFSFDNPTDPIAATAAVQSPSGVASVFSILDATLIRESIGVYHFDLVPSESGTYAVEAAATGNLEVTELSTIEAEPSDSFRVPSWLTSADLNRVIGAARTDFLFDDDGDGKRDPMKVNQILLQAEDEVSAKLKRAYTDDQIVLLCKNDIVLRNHSAWIAAELASESRSEFIAEDGKGRYWVQYTRALTHFELLSKSQVQTSAKKVAGNNAQSGGKIQPQLPPETPRFTFAPDKDAPTGHGGF